MEDKLKKGIQNKGKRKIIYTFTYGLLNNTLFY